MFTFFPFSFYHYINYSRPGGIGPAALFWPDQFFLKVKATEIPLLQKACNKQSASVILGLVSLIILTYNR